jgi:hypothetical protein
MPKNYWKRHPEARKYTLDAPQDCGGVLVKLDHSFFALDFDPGSGQWCDADIVDEAEAGGENLLGKVLKVCEVDHRCRIRGRIAGHGAFRWVKIWSVSREKDPPAAFVPLPRPNWLRETPPPNTSTGGEVGSAPAPAEPTAPRAVKTQRIRLTPAEQEELLKPRGF